MADDEFGPYVAESTLADDHPMGVDPRLYSDDGAEPAPVWASSQRLREVVERQERRPPDADRRLLASEAQRQLSTLGLFREVVRLFAGPIDPRSAVTLYVILFPGEAKDNTGIKELNDKVLGYRLTSEFIVARQEEIRAVFPPPDDRTGPRYTTVGQDYKTASIVAVAKPPEDFAKDLARLDARLRERLLGLLDRAEKDSDTNPAFLPEIRKLRRKLEKDKSYRFDYLFGANTVSIRGRPVDVVFQLLTESLKGAGMARFAAKGKAMKKWVSRDMARNRGVDSPDKGHDPRGRVYRSDPFLKVLKAADDIKDLMAKPPHRDAPVDYHAIFVDTVWTTTFLPYKRLYFGNPDVIRDVRKRALVAPTFKKGEGQKLNFTAQREMLELWLVTLNAIDFVKDFVSTEYPRFVDLYHAEALLVLEQLLDKGQDVDWPRLARFLTRDFRQGSEPVSLQGTASEFQFYSHAADQQEQVFFMLDIRDLGVELMAFYETAQMTITDDRLAGLDLMVETFRSTDAIVVRRRFTYDKVVEAFKKRYPEAAGAGSRAAAGKAFGTALRTEGAMPPFRDSIRVMLGGDEVFVAAHPYYARCAHAIIADLASPTIAVQDRPLNLRAGVGYSTAARAPGPAPAGNDVSDAQRRENQKAHDKVLKLATDSLTMLKPLERTQRRIERLIEMLEANDQKKDLAPPHRRKLADLRLLEVYARVMHGYPKQLSTATYARLHRLLRAGDLRGALATKLFELVDFAGNVVDEPTLTRRAAELEAAVRRDVGKDNVHVDGPPVTKIPAWIQKVLDKWLKDNEAKTRSA